MSLFFTNFPKTKYDVFFDNQQVDIVDIFRIVKVKKSFKDDITFYTFYNVQDGERPDVVSTKLYGTPDYYWTFFMLNDNLVNLHKDWPLSTSDALHLVDKKYPGYVVVTDDDISTKFVKDNVVEGLISGARAKVIAKDPDLGVMRIEPISGTLQDNELLYDSITTDFITIKSYALWKDVAHHYEDVDGNYVTKSTLGATPISNEQYEFALNDDKSSIKVIRPQYVQAIADQFIEQIQAE